MGALRFWEAIMAEVNVDRALTNNPPALKDRLNVDFAHVIEASDKLLEKAADFIDKPILDDAGLEPVSDHIKDIVKYTKRIEALRTDEKEPYLEGGRIVDSFFKSITKRLDDQAASLNKITTKYLKDKSDREREEREERARIAREEQRRIAAETQRKLDEAAAADRAAREAAARAQTLGAARAAEQAQADAERSFKAALESERKEMLASAAVARAERQSAAAPSDMARTRGGASLATLRTTWEFEIEDAKSIPLDILRPHIPAEAINQALRSFIKAGGREIAGVRIFEDSKAMVR